MTYTNVFGGNTIYPSDVSYLSITLSVDTPLEWPLESSGTEAPAARIIDVDPSASGFSVVLPDATLTGAGQTILFNNTDVTYSFFVKDYAGNTLATVTAGTQWQVYLAATTTAAGTWRVFRYGASTATVQPSALAGFGLTVTGSTLSQSLPVSTFSTTGTTVATSNRASAFVWTATGAGTLNLLTAASAGNNFFIFVRNEGGGDLTIDPAGSETINGASTLVLSPNDSATIITDGATWYTIGLGKEAVFAFDYTVLDIPVGTTTLTLSGSQLNRIAYKFTSSTPMTADCYIVVPSTIQQYWITNATTGGSFRLYVQTSGGAPTQVNRNAKGIYYCDGVNMVLASDPTALTTPIVVAQGGTGGTTQSDARLGIGITPFADPIVTATAGGTVRTTIGAAASGTNTDITVMNPASGLQIGSPTLGAQGAGTINATGLFVNGAAVGTGSGTVTAVSVVSANGFAGTVTATSTPAITLRTSITGVLKGNGTAISAATAGTDYVAPGGALGTPSSGTLTNCTFPTLNQNTTGSAATSGSAATLTTARTFTIGATGKTFNGSANVAWTLGEIGAAASGANGDITSLTALTSIPTGTTINGVVIGYRNIPRSTTTTTAVVGDVGKCIVVTADIAIPNSTFAAGDAVSIYNAGAGSITITASVATLRLAGTTTTGNRTLARYGMATVWFNSATEAIISGSGVS